MTSKEIILAMKYARVIEGIAERMELPVLQVMDLFYHSRTYRDMHEGIGELHCRSDKYVIDEFLIERQKETHV